LTLTDAPPSAAEVPLVRTSIDVDGDLFDNIVIIGVVVAAVWGLVWISRGRGEDRIDRRLLRVLHRTNVEEGGQGADDASPDPLGSPLQGDARGSVGSHTPSD
jgi:hypothetical protein